MSETVSDPHRLTALELANHHVGEAPNQIVDRAHAYHAFLTGKATGKPATAGTTQTAAARLRNRPLRQPANRRP